MNVRRTILLAAAATFAAGARAEGDAKDTQQQPPSNGSQQSWYQRDAGKARELGERGTDAAKRGASATGRKLNEGGQAATAKVVGTKTVSGEVADVSPERLTVKKDDGTPMSLRITGSTKVTIGGQQGSPGSLHEGDEVRASYAQSGGSATATKIEVKTSTGASRSPAQRRGAGGK